MCNATDVCSPHRADFNGIAESIDKFTADNDYDVDKWLMDFDRLQANQCGDYTKYLLLRRRLDGTTKLWLNRLDVNN